MLEAICLMLNGLTNTDTRISQTTKDGIIDLIRNVYGDHAADTVDELFVIVSDRPCYMCYDEVEDALRICLQGRG